MRARDAATVAAILCGTLAPLAAAHAQDQGQVPVCPSPEKAQQVARAGASAALPEGCRLVHVRRLDTPAGPVCGVDFTAAGRGATGAIADAMTTTQWWTACANLRIR